MIVAGIDPSLTSAGIAVLRDGQPALLTSLGHGSVSVNNYAHQSRRIVSQSRAVMAALVGLGPETPKWVVDSTGIATIDLAVIEGPAWGLNSASSHAMAGLWWGIYSALLAKRIPVAVVQPSTLKQFATGKGNADKKAMLAAAKQWCPRVRGDDQADAAWLACMGHIHLGGYPPVALTDWRLNNMKSVVWPKSSIASPQCRRCGDRDVPGHRCGRETR